MSPKNSNGVALERRADLASLFCMVGRHGPAVALAVVAVLSLLAAAAIYRTVRGKRRKAAAGAAAAAESDAPRSPRREPSPEETLSCGEATDVSDRDSSAAGRVLTNPKLRLRHAAEKKSLPCSPKSDVHASDDRHDATSRDTEVFKAAYKKDESVATDKSVSDERNKQEEHFQQTSNKPVYFDQTLHLSENVHSLQDNKCTSVSYGVESNQKEEVTHTEDVPASFICYGKYEQFEEHYHPDSTDYSNCLSNNQLCPEETKEAEDKAPVENNDGDEDGGLAGEVMEEVLDKDNLNNFTAVKSDIHSSEEEIKQKDGLACNEEEPVPPGVVFQVKEKTLTKDGVACGDDGHSSCVVLGPTLPLNSDNHDLILPGITTEAKAQLSAIADFLDCQQAQTEVKEGEIAPTLDKDTALNISHSDLLPLEKEIQCENYETGAAVRFTEGIIDPQHQQSGVKTGKTESEAFDNLRLTAAPDQFACDAENAISHVMAEVACYEDQHFTTINNESFGKTEVAAADKTDRNIPASAKTAESSHNLPSVSQDKQNDCLENSEACDEESVDATYVCDGDTSEEMSHPDRPSSFQEQQNEQVQNKVDFEVTVGAATVTTEDRNTPICKINLLCFEQSQLSSNNDGMSSPGAGKESGISSMTVSPDVQDSGNEFDMMTDNVVLPVMDCDPQPDERRGAQVGLFADDAAFSVNEATAGTVPYHSHDAQKPHSDHTDEAIESFAANQDTFGHDIEDGYHSALDKFMTQITESVMSFTSDLKKKMDTKVVVADVKVSKEQERVEKEAEEEKEEHEKTEISIMEATMDTNEWITDSNYQVLPWMNVSVPSFAQDNRKTSQLFTEKCQHSSRTDMDIAASTEVTPTNTQYLGDENNKKVVAVQPMPQNVNVTFRIHYLTHSPYQTVAVTGNQQELGNWKGFIPLERAKDGLWATVVSLPTESHVEWKFVLVEKGQVCRWEECGNRLLDTGCGDDLIVHKWWGFL